MRCSPVASSVSAHLKEWTACLFSTSTSPTFSSLAYFVSHTATDGQPAEDIKSIRDQNIHMRHVQNVEVGHVNTIFESFMSSINIKGSYLQPPNVNQQQVMIV